MMELQKMHPKVLGNNLEYLVRQVSAESPRYLQLPSHWDLGVGLVF
jgi:hypothetical protein